MGVDTAVITQRRERSIHKSRKLSKTSQTAKYRTRLLVSKNLFQLIPYNNKIDANKKTTTHN